MRMKIIPPNIKIYEDKDIFLTDADAIVNTVNTVGVMGKGLALQFKKLYPKMFAEYKERCNKGEVKVGLLDIHYIEDTNNESDPKIIINFPTKEHWRGKSKGEYIVNGLDNFRNIAQDLNIKSIAFPALGCGLGGLDWAVVRTLMIHHFKQINLDFEIYVPSELEDKIQDDPAL